MLYQIGIVLIIVVAAIIFSKKLSQKDELIFEDEMDKDELKKIDDEINYGFNSLSRELKNSLIAKTTIIENGTPKITTEV